MKPFESILAPQLEAYVAYRQSLGYTDKNRNGVKSALDSCVAWHGIEMGSSLLLTLVSHGTKAGLGTSIAL